MGCVVMLIHNISGAKMVEIVISRKKRINLGNFESEEIMASMKSEIPDNESITAEMQELNKIVKDFVEKEIEKARKKEK